MATKEKKTRKTKRERFLTVAQDRTNKVLRAVQLLRKCSNQQSYEYSDAEAKEIFEAVGSELKACEESFYNKRAFSFASAPQSQE